MANNKKKCISRSPVERALLIIQIVATIAAVAALGVLLWSWFESQQSRQAFTELQNRYTIQAAALPSAAPQEQASQPEPISGEEEELPEQAQEKAFPLLQVNFTELQRDWPDVVAWIQWPLMELNYPILHGSSNAQYLRALPDGTWNEGGSIFLEANNQSILDLHAIVYGHNMKNGSMFGRLKSYVDEDFFTAHEGETSFVLYTPEGVWEYDVFSVEQVKSTDTGVYTICHAAGEGYIALVEGMQERSLYDMGVMVDGSQPVLTLSTCDDVGASLGNRFVLHAVRGKLLY